MPSEPKKPIEQMLEALAKARRAEFGDDPKMPNPMRARLHDEIARVGAPKEENGDSRPSWITMFWLRITVATALATLLVLVPAIWWNQSHPVAESGDLALRSRNAGAVDKLNPAAAANDTLSKPPAISTEPTVNLADNHQTKSEAGATTSSEAEISRSGPHVAEGRGMTESPADVTKGFANNEIASAAPAAAPPGAADSKAKSGTMAAAAPGVTEPSSAGNLIMTRGFSQQSAVQSFRNKAQVSQSANVLNTFQVQQQGNEIRLIDADGSTYTGKIEQLAKNAQLDSRTQHYAAKQARKDAAQATGEKESTANHFRATGYNVSLKKTVVFEGNYTAPPAQQPAMATFNDKQRAESSRDQARIVGKVRVNGETPVEVNATADTPAAAATKKSEK